MKIELSGLKMPYGVEADFDELDLADSARISGRIHIHAVIEGNESSATVDGNLEGKVVLECSRCLTEEVWPLKVEFHLNYLSSDVFAVEDGHQLTDAELIADEIMDGGIDLKVIAREQVILALPQHHLCSQDCVGLCISCGANLNEEDCGCTEQTVDPRWEALKNLN